MGGSPEGVIKFQCLWVEAPIRVADAILGPLRFWRATLRERGLLGALPDGTGFGNLSVRVGGEGRGAFLITGSGTGSLPEISVSHLSLVTEYSIRENLVRCRGLVKASSESLSHAAIYEAEGGVGAVVHIHSPSLWKRYRGRLPTTDEALEYGTPELAEALQRIVQGGPKGTPGAVVLGGHRDGLMVFGPDLNAAGERILALGIPLPAEPPQRSEDGERIR